MGSRSRGKVMAALSVIAAALLPKNQPGRNASAGSDASAIASAPLPRNQPGRDSLGEGSLGWAEVVLGGVALAWCVMRFIGLDHVPYGLWPDEALAGLHVDCLAQTGASADGQRWPLFATGLAGGLYTPTYLYTLFAWSRLFGTSIRSLRGLAATFSIAAIAGIWLLVRRLAGRRAAYLAVVAAALSPWSFQFARFAVDPPMAPMLLVFAAYLFVHSPRVPWAAAAGVVMALAAYTYPPVRVQAALLVLLLLWVERARLDRARIAALAVAMGGTAAPLAVLMLQGKLLARSKALSILSADYIKANHGHLNTFGFVLKQLLDNLHEHLRPSYLFFTGDPNIRHSTQVMGELGWLDILAVGCFCAAVGLVVIRTLRRLPPPSIAHPHAWALAGCAIVAGGFATLPAALCWEGLPHALRSIGAWPAVAAFTGAVLSSLWARWRAVPIAAVVLALGQTAHFVPYFFRAYPKASYEAWAGPLRDAAESRDPTRFANVARAYDPLEYRYYLMHAFGDSCATSRDDAERIANGMGFTASH
jgi:4-amino-4-deoxy-L-arabinose transferase-like glycosyltransferase